MPMPYDDSVHEIFLCIGLYIHWSFKRVVTIKVVVGER